MATDEQTADTAQQSVDIIIEPATSDNVEHATGSCRRKRKFESVNDEELQQIGQSECPTAKNTERATAGAVRVFQEYLISKGKTTDFESMSPDQLDVILGKFYAELRDPKGEMYKRTTMMSYRQGLQRYLQSKRKDIDIIWGPKFKESNGIFKAMTKELKRQGYGDVDHHPPIADRDLQQIYNYLCSSDSAQTLQHKVFMDVMLHFGKLGRQSLRNFKGTDFAVTVDDDGDMYVYIAGNDQDDDSTKGRMYELKGNPRCPVKSFIKYLERLNPNCPYLFQQARDVPKDGVYYNNVVLGHNKLGAMLPEICVKAALTTRYTNPSLRATTLHMLDASKFSSHQGKTASGCTDDKRKKRVSRAINSSLGDILEDLPGVRVQDLPGERMLPNQLPTNQPFDIPGKISVKMEPPDFTSTSNMFSTSDTFSAANSFSMPSEPARGSNIILHDTNTTIPLHKQYYLVLNNCSNITINYVLPNSDTSE